MNSSKRKCDSPPHTPPKEEGGEDPVLAKRYVINFMTSISMFLFQLDDSKGREREAATQYFHFVYLMSCS